MEKILNNPEFDLDETDWRGNFFPSYYVQEPIPVCHLTWGKPMQLKPKFVKQLTEENHP